MNAPLFSVVTPVYDPPVDVLGDTIALGAARRSFDDWELDPGRRLLTDRGGPRACSASTRPADPRIRVVERETNGHIVAASNDGIDGARSASSSCCSTTTTC